jgi:hypothetical protein
MIDANLTTSWTITGGTSESYIFITKPHDLEPEENYGCKYR